MPQAPAAAAAPTADFLMTVGLLLTGIRQRTPRAGEVAA